MVFILMKRKLAGSKTRRKKGVEGEKASKKTERKSLAKPTFRSTRRVPETKQPTGLAQLLSLREEIRHRMPRFQRQESWRYRRIHKSWRKPRGVDSKMRKLVKGWPKIAKIGYRVPRAVRGYHPSGMQEVLVHTLPELEGLNPENQAVRLGSKLGARARAALLSRAKELGIRVLNPRGLRTIGVTNENVITQKEGVNSEDKKEQT
jgi:large subunit ribosomal protein L32e